MELSNKLEYALLALLQLATNYQNDEPLQISKIAALKNIPKRYLEQLLATLRRGGLINSTRGSKGGYVLAREPWKITILDVMNCMEGLEAAAVTACHSVEETVEIKVIEEIRQEARQAANSVLQKYTLQDLCERQATQRSLGTMYYI
ncbi:hypothetical protein NIES4071_104280 (plasmid) [Calothrix sp. NIES-4071]|nr:hypothetical protein NIES4071_104280 [Calothrix sp. NIES-4071]BAZ64415.1 hypothetical protein NIES4105_101480 [Calothrix sp. NIES-4105]